MKVLPSQMQRATAIEMLATAQLSHLSSEQRANLLLKGRWLEEDQFKTRHAVSVEMRNEVDAALTDGLPIQNIDDQRWNPLVVEALVQDYKIVRNEYISQKLTDLSSLHEKDFPIEGEPSLIFACPCCSYRTLEARGEYDICEACFWEDDGSNDPERYSGPNHMTLKEGQENFRLLGACSPQVKGFVDPEAHIKFVRAAN